MRKEKYWQRNACLEGSKEHLLRLWERYSKLVSSEQNDDVIDEENALIERIEEILPFINEEEHKHWLDVSATYRCWEDFEELTLSIINHLSQEERDDLILAYEKVAKDLCLNSEFYALFNAFKKLSHGWVDTMDNWNSWWQEMSKNEDDVCFFFETYKEIYGKSFSKKDIMGFYGFETCPHPMFYKNDLEGKSDLMDCIFERYAMGLEDEECMSFFKELIKELN